MLQTDDIGFQIKLIHDGMDRLFRRELGKDFPTCSQLKVLQYLLIHPGEKILVKDIVEYLHIDQSTASGIIKRMEKNGYILCTQDPEDRRQKQISIHPQGQHFSAEANRRDSNKIEEILLKGISQSERQELCRLLSIMYQNLQES